MKKAILYLHGKGGSACEVEQYAKNCPDFYLHGVDYQGSLPWLVQEQIVSDYRMIPSSCLPTASAPTLPCTPCKTATSKKPC